MKSINDKFEDNEWEELNKAKGSMTWHDFIMTLVKEK